MICKIAQLPQAQAEFCPRRPVHKALFQLFEPACHLAESVSPSNQGWFEVGSNEDGTRPSLGEVHINAILVEPACRPTNSGRRLELSELDHGLDRIESLVGLVIRIRPDGQHANADLGHQAQEEIMQDLARELYSTYSIVAQDPETGQFGVAVQTHQMTVGNFVPWLAPGAGALATQALGNIRFGPMGLAMLRQGIPAQQVVDGLVATDTGADHRQLAVVDSQGRVAAWTGPNCIEYAGHHIGEGYSVQANMMTKDTVIEAMVGAYESAEGGLAQRLVAALQAAQSEDGDIRGKQSAALRVVRGEAPQFQDPAEWRPVYDLRVDEHVDPVDELARLVRLRRAQLLDQEGHNALESDDRERAMELWAEARLLAPELEEIVYWQALTLADKPAEVDRAVEILEPMLTEDPRRDHWIDLIERVKAAGLFEREGAAEELLAALDV